MAEAERTPSASADSGVGAAESALASSEPFERIWTRDGFVEDRFREADGAVFMSCEEATARLGSGSLSVLRLEAGDDPRAVAGRIDEFDAAFIRFPTFSDGRGFSTARMLRERLGYEGTIRATGSFILDQLPFMLRTGFDEFAISHPATLSRLESEGVEALAGVNLFLQPALGGESLAGGRAWARKPKP